MFNRMGMNKKSLGKELGDIESILQSSLKPVSPRPEFITNLQKGLMDYTFPPGEDIDADLKRTFVFALIGLAGFVFVFSLWVRLIIVVISSLGMIQSSKMKRRAK